MDIGDIGSLIGQVAGGAIKQIGLANALVIAMSVFIVKLTRDKDRLVQGLRRRRRSKPTKPKPTKPKRRR